MDKTPQPKLRRLLTLGRTFLFIGPQAFGGQPILEPMLVREFVEKRCWTTIEEVSDAFTFTRFLPGPTIVQAVAYLGFRMAGSLGTLVSLLGFLAMPFAATLALAAAYRHFSTQAPLMAIERGMTAAVVGVVALAVLRMGSHTLRTTQIALIGLATFAGIILLHLHPALLVGIAGLLGIGEEVVQQHRSRNEHST